VSTVNDEEKDFKLTTVGEAKQRDVSQAPGRLLDRSNVPNELHELIPYAEKWGLSDDTLREELVANSSRETLADLVAKVTAANPALSRWLRGTEAQLPRPSPEYIAFSAMRMLADDLRSTLK
jgi:hypothetical protein